MIVTLVMNQLAGLLTGLMRLGRVPPPARLALLAHGTKLNVGVLLALPAVGFVYVWLWRSSWG